MNKMSPLGLKFSVGLFLMFAAWSANAELLLSAPPRESAEDAENIYGPIAKVLSEATGERVQYVHAVNWIEYSESMRKGKYDIVFDGPHFAAWRMKHLGHVPVAKLPGSLIFDLVVKESDEKARRPQDIKSSSICALAPPNLGAMAILTQFSNPVIQPTIVESQDLKAVMEGFKAGKCRAAVVPEQFMKKMPEDARKKFRVLFTSPVYPDQTVTVGPKVNEKERAEIADLLVAPKGLPAASKLLAIYTKQATHFEPVKTPDYDGLEDLLEGEIWGW